MKIVQSYLYR